MKILSVEEINERIKFDAKAFVEERERLYMENIEKIAGSLNRHTSDNPVILLSGPSGSGKTTTSMRIEQILDRMGVETHAIAMDDYFLTCDKNEKAKGTDGVIDYESPYRVDIELLSDHLMKIANCEAVELPRFNFATQTSEKSGRIFKRKPGELVIIEGIHALNPLVTGKSAEFACGIYISVRTRIEASDGTLLHPSKIRLMRRLNRDRIHRARSFAESMARYKSVENGASKYILPFKDNAKFQIDSFMGYEPAVFKTLLYEELLGVKDGYAGFDNFADMVKVLSETEPLGTELIPDSSLIREFIGKSAMTY